MKYTTTTTHVYSKRKTPIHGCGYLQVVYVRRLEVLLKVFNLSVQRDAEHVDLLQVLIAGAGQRINRPARQ